LGRTSEVGEREREEEARGGGRELDGREAARGGGHEVGEAAEGADGGLASRGEVQGEAFERVEVRVQL
jgi:hypothetical protein